MWRHVRGTDGIEKLERRYLLAGITPLADSVVVTTDETNLKIVLYNTSSGATTTFDAQVHNPENARLSPDRTKILYDAHNIDPQTGPVAGSFLICTINVDGSDFKFLTGSGHDSHASWSSDGSRIVFTSDRDGNDEIYTMNADGSSQTRLTNNSADDKDPSFSPDGSKIIFASNSPGKSQIFAFDSTTGGNLVRLTNDSNSDTQPVYSPDGGRVAFSFYTGASPLFESGVMLMDARGVAGGFTPDKVDSGDLQISFFSPSFSPDGKQIAMAGSFPAEGGRINLYDAETFQRAPSINLDQFAQSVNWGSASTFVGEYKGIITVNGTPGNDSISFTDDGQNLTFTLNGKSQQFSTTGFHGLQIFAGAGDDVVDGSHGVTAFYASGDAGNDELIGGQFNDTLTGGAGRNTLFGGDGDDRLNGSGGRDFIYGDNGNDREYGNGGNDYMVGGAGVDRMWGGDGDDLLSGNSGNDKMFGEAGNDQLIGGDGNDLCYGGLGTDTVNGQKGTDSSDGDNSDVLIQIEVVP